jgi:zinc protease
MLSQLLTKGTKNKTPEDLENAIENLGASINAYTDGESILLSGTTLAKTISKP